MNTNIATTTLSYQQVIVMDRNMLVSTAFDCVTFDPLAERFLSFATKAIGVFPEWAVDLIRESSRSLGISIPARKTSAGLYIAQWHEGRLCIRTASPDPAIAAIQCFILSRRSVDVEHNAIDSRTR